MAKIKFKCAYGNGYRAFKVPNKNFIAALLPNKPPKGLTGEREVLRALQNPIGSVRLSDIARGKKRVVIITSDITRPLPGKEVLPTVLDELYAADIKPEQITVVFALGIHRPHTEEEKRRLVGDRVFENIHCVDSSKDYVRVGTTAMGTPVDIFSEVAEADFKICLGNIEYHWFAGYSGGVKAVVPGVSGRETINANHSFLTDEKAKAGSLDDNPVRRDIEEAGKLVGVDFIVNVILDEHKAIIRAVAGSPVAAHREGCRFLDSVYRSEIPKKADIVIASAGGYPKDINIYQSQKALDNAGLAVRDGGIIIWVCRANEGFGEETFEAWLRSAKTPQSIRERILKEFVVGGHKAAGIANILEKAQIFLVSDLTPEDAEILFVRRFTGIQKALREAFRQLGRDSGVLFMPVGGATLPVERRFD